MKVETLPVVKGDYLLKDYEQTAATFRWEDVEKEFSWYESGKVNIAYEAVDRHVDTYRKNKVALYYKDADRKETYTYAEMKKMTNRAANVLQSHSSLEKGTGYLFLCHAPRNFIFHY